MTGEPQDNPGGQQGGDSNAQGQPPSRLLAGKYRSVPDLERGYMESSLEAQRIIMEKRALELEVDSLRRQVPPPEPEPDFLPIEGEGIPRAQIQKLVTETARNIVAETLQPLVRGAEARQQMEERYPGFGEIEGEIKKLIFSDPQMKAVHDEIAKGSPIGALEFSYAQYRAREESQRANQQANQQDLNHSRNQGRIVGPRPSGPGRSEAEEEFSQQKYDELLRKAQETNNWDDFLDYRFKKILPAWQFDANADWRR